MGHPSDMCAHKRMLTRGTLKEGTAQNRKVLASKLFKITFWGTYSIPGTVPSNYVHKVVQSSAQFYMQGYTASKRKLEKLARK